MEKSHKKRSPKTPPSTGTKRRRSPRQHNAMVHEKGSGPVGRGGKMRNIEERGRAFSSSSELESDNEMIRVKRMNITMNQRKLKC